MSQPLGLLADVVPFSWVDGPGNRFAVFLQGCNLDCLVCHNPHTMPLQTPLARSVTVAELVDEVRPQAPYLSGVTVSGGEATLQAPFVAAWFDALREDPATAHLTRFVDSNGCADDEVWDLLLPRTEGVMLDLKALDLGTHLELTGSSNFPVLRSLDRLALAHKLAEVRLLIVPGRNDSEETLRRTGAYVAARAPGVPVRVIGFRPHGVRAAARSIPEPTPEERAHYGAWVAESVGADLVTVV
ncbi:radical SAM protein [Longivirga aurantiaca]|uniref:Radical SAM protein n=1 Tax=Longivirga aurantiaca TaxID=1837743 RepID=A0ABW1SW57_9ACTN